VAFRLRGDIPGVTVEVENGERKLAGVKLSGEEDPEFPWQVSMVDKKFEAPPAE